MPIWVIVFSRSGEQQTIIRCYGEREMDHVVFHNTYYKHPCLVVRVKCCH